MCDKIREEIICTVYNRQNWFIIKIKWLAKQYVSKQGEMIPAGSSVNNENNII